MLVRRVVPPSGGALLRPDQTPAGAQPTGAHAQRRSYWIDWTAFSRIGGMSPLA
jgi:hypothetical protein